jgi:hypothetical protein
MVNRMTWPELCRSERYKGLWVALDNCRYDSVTRQPVEGDVVDSDPELAELCARMRGTGRCACTILFCQDHVFVQDARSAESGVGSRGGARPGESQRLQG